MLTVLEVNDDDKYSKLIQFEFEIYRHINEGLIIIEIYATMH